VLDLLGIRCGRRTFMQRLRSGVHAFVANKRALRRVRCAAARCDLRTSRRTTAKLAARRRS
jgi:hypothetical protein